ncbi:MAG: hypothetical protein Q4D66_05850 [Bacteroidales bacterium]|nr:hypothetical protein [Bacteroidales bacterium]
MRPLSTLQSLLYQLGGLLLLAGAVLPLVPSLGLYAPYVFTTGVLMFVSMQLLQRYEGHSVVLRRLRRQQLIGAGLLVLSAAVMWGKWLNIGPLRGDEWKIVLLIAAVLQLYTAFRIPAQLNKEGEAH